LHGSTAANWVLSSNNANGIFGMLDGRKDVAVEVAARSARWFIVRSELAKAETNANRGSILAD
jgi:hypothetical protein